MSIGDTLAVLSIAVAFAFYRLEVLRTRRRDSEAAKALLLAVKHAMVGHQDEKGWGAEYFANRWTDEKAEGAAQRHAKMIMEGAYEQVMMVPTEPIAALVGSSVATPLISEDTLYAANLALWHIAGFNQLVEQHTSMLATALFEINKPGTTQDEQCGISAAVGTQARLLHKRGVGEPNEPGGWYRRLREAVDADIARIDRESAWRRLYGLPEVFAALLLAGALTAFGWAVATADDDSTKELPPARQITTTP